jgi:HEAT repeat protein
VSRHKDVLWDRDDRPVDLGAAVRAEAVQALAEFYGPEVVEGLYEAIGDRDAKVRRAAVTGLLALDSPAVATALIAALVDWPEGHDPQLRADAATGLEAIDASGLPEAYAATLLESDRATAMPFDRQVLEALLAADARGPAARQALVDFLISRLESSNDDSEAVTESVLEWLAADSVEPLLRCLEARRGRIPAARLLGASRDSRAVEPLVHLLADPDPDARATAATALGRLKHAGSVEALLLVTRDEEYAVRDAAMTALDGMGAAAVTVGLASMVEPMQLAARSAEPADGASKQQQPQALPWAERMLHRLLGPGQGT